MKIIKLSGVSLGTPIISPSRSLTHKAGRAVLVCLLTSLSGQALANPTGAQIVNGSVQINAIANQLNIHNSNGAIINWQNFSIGQQEITRFIQQNSTSAVLNRVVGQNPSAIMGQLLSNGHVFLLNPNGVVFGANAVVDTAGLVASSLNMSDESFLSGKYKFSGDGSNGAVINRGLITAGKGGEIVLIAPTVENHGVISVEGGRILLAAGQKMTLSSLDLEGIEFEVQAPTNTAMNLGKLLASGGSVGVFAGSLTNTGVINANSVTKGKDGKLWLEAIATATIGGKLSAPDITIAGSDIALNGADISASTEDGGGQIRIGGDYQGATLGPNTQNAKTVTVDATTTISANAQSQGDGGRVIIWSDENTVVNGHISATGGSQSGNGGFVETSGKKALDFTTPVDVSAVNGKAGTWLIDPEDITIDAGKASSIETALNEGSNVEVKTSDTGEGEGNITVAAAITKTGGGDATLSLDAHNKIDVNAPITSTSNKLNVKLTAGNEVNVNSNITTNGGSVATLITGTTATAETPIEVPVDLATDTTSEPASEPVTEPVPDATAEASTETTPSETVVTVEEAVADLNTSIAGSIETSGGDISINAGETGSVLVEGTLDASNYEAGATGGNIEVLGDQVELAGDALLDASGDAGGGTVKIGGDYQGQGDTPTATNTGVGESVIIKADAVTDGDGGTVIVWADETTQAYGQIYARGGEQSGDGGFVETSGKKLLVLGDYAPDASADNGKAGTWLLDPENINITTVSANSTPPTGSGDPGPISFLPIADNTTTTIDVALINTALNNGSDVVIDTSSGGTDRGDIYVSSAISKTADGGNGDGSTLSLNADGYIFIRESITSTSGVLDLNLLAGVSVRIINENNITIDTNGGLIQVQTKDVSGGTILGSLTFAPIRQVRSVDINGDLNAQSITLNNKVIANFNGATSVVNYSQNNATTLGGTGEFSVSGNYSWVDGFITGTVNILERGSLDISSLGSIHRLTGTINNYGAATLNDNSLEIYDAAVFNNMATGVFNFTGDGSSAAILTNAGGNGT
ncbi:MAG: filamentous hemagglutinin N-terminal domain-containing protein, partial [Gammaproteobacteria bacterium]|nr:filamentous hemagglutinin N-terminal domain-containing protein [Gammaproteobacteria bacterium]